MNVDNSNQFIICTFDNQKIGLFKKETAAFIKVVPIVQGVTLDKVHIDDLTSFMGCLDESGTFLHILVFEWVYCFDKPDKRLKKKGTMKVVQRKKLKGGVIYDNRIKKS